MELSEAPPHVHMLTLVIAHPALPAAPGELAGGVGVLDWHGVGRVCRPIDVEVERSSTLNHWCDNGVGLTLIAEWHKLRCSV